jgi:hypothetical protein
MDRGASGISGAPHGGGDLAAAARRRLAMLACRRRSSSASNATARRGRSRPIVRACRRRHHHARHPRRHDVSPGRAACDHQWRSRRLACRVAAASRRRASRAPAGASSLRTCPLIQAKSFAGRIESVLPAADAATRTIEVRIALANPEGPLAAGHDGGGALPKAMRVPRCSFQPKPSSAPGGAPSSSSRWKAAAYAPVEIELGRRSRRPHRSAQGFAKASASSPRAIPDRFRSQPDRRAGAAGMRRRRRKARRRRARSERPHHRDQWRQHHDRAWSGAEPEWPA